MKPYIIGVSGGSGAGKTSFTECLRATFLEHELCIISQDDYYFPIQEQKKDENGIQNFDLPTSINHQLLYEDLQQIKQGLTIEKQKYNFNNDKTSAGVARLCPAPIILVEGIFIFHFEKLRSLYDLKIFVHAKEDLKLIRRIKRDQTERNYPVEDVLYQYENHVMPAYEKYIKPYFDEADIVINNNITFEHGFQVIRGFICNYLREIEYKQK